MRKILSIVLVIAVFLVGCSSSPASKAKTTATPSEVSPITTKASATDVATTKADNATAGVTTRTDARDAKVLANINTAKDANTGNPDGPAKTVVEGELATAQASLTDVQPDPVELAAAAQRRALVESGKAAEARSAYAGAQAQATKLSSDLDAARTEKANAIAERDAARTDEKNARTGFLAQLEQNKKDNAAAIQLALDQANDQTRKQQVMYLNIAAGVFLLVFFAGVGFGGIAGLRVTWPFGLFAVLCFGLAQIISQWWFKWACLSVALVAVGIAIWWVIKHYKLGTLTADTQKKADALQAVVHDVVPVLDTAYENVDQAGKDLLDKHVFQPLSSAMDKASKDIVTVARASVNLNQPTAVPAAPAN